MTINANRLVLTLLAGVLLSVAQPIHALASLVGLFVGASIWSFQLPPDHVADPDAYRLDNEANP